MKNNGRMETLEYMGVNFLAEDVIRNKISNLKNISRGYFKHVIFT